MNGTKLSSSLDTPYSFVFELNSGQVIDGWDWAIERMSTGTKAMVVVPPEWNFKDETPEGIPPNSTLKFEIELISFRDKMEPTVEVKDPGDGLNRPTLGTIVTV